MKEIWKDIKGYEGLYQVSNLGRVKSLARVVVMKNNVERLVSTRIKKASLDKRTGYYSVSLSKNGVNKTKKIHVLVAIAFLGHTPDGHSTLAHHIDEDRTNNIVGNLEIVPAREHTTHHATNNSTGEHNIYQLSSGNFIIGIWFKGTLYSIGTYETIEEAIIVRDVTLAEIEAKTFVPRPVRPPAEKQSKYCCVRWDKERQKWVARVKGKFLGRFITEEEAHQAVLKYKL